MSRPQNPASELPPSPFELLPPCSAAGCPYRGEYNTPRGWYCDPCGNADAAAWEQRRALAERGRERETPAPLRLPGTAYGQGVKIHLASLRGGGDPAACGSFAERWTDDPELVTCRKCRPAARRRPGPLPSDPDLRRAAARALGGDGQGRLW